MNATATATAIFEGARPHRAVSRETLNPTLLRIEIKRVLRNRTSLIFAVVLPVAFFLMFGTDKEVLDKPYGSGNVGAVIMIGMALYGALGAACGSGARVSAERADGWTRQLRLTPLRPGAYIIAKCVAGLMTSALAVASVNVAGWLTGTHMPGRVWLASALITWACSLVFVAFGLAIGYTFKSDNAMQVIGPGLAMFAFLGGLFVPIQEGSVLDTISKLTPMYGLRKLSLSPLGAGDFSAVAVVNAVSWFVVFGGWAAVRMARDTDRV